MVNTKLNRFEVNDTVRVNTPEGSLGIVQYAENNPMGLYLVQTGRRSVQFYTEKQSYESDLSLHPDAFQVKPGNVIVLDGFKYFVESTKLTKKSDSEIFPTLLNIAARRLNGGKYDASTQLIEFVQPEDKPLTIVGGLEKSLFK